MTVKIDDFSQAIKRYRKLTGLSQKELADLAGVGKTVIFDLEKGKSTVRLDTFLKVCATLNIKVFLQTPLMDAHEKG